MPTRRLDSDFWQLRTPASEFRINQGYRPIICSCCCTWCWWHKTTKWDEMSLPARQQHTFLLATFEWLPSKPPAADNSHIIIHPAAYPIIIHESNIHTQILQHTQASFLSLLSSWHPSPLSHGTHTCLLAKAPPTPATVLMHLWPKRVMGQKMKSLPPVLFCTTVLSFGRRPVEAAQAKLPLKKGCKCP